jgi:hypothetical protein
MKFEKPKKEINVIEYLQMLKNEAKKMSSRTQKTSAPDSAYMTSQTTHDSKDFKVKSSLNPPIEGRIMLKVHGNSKEYPITQKQFMIHYSYLDFNHPNKNKSLYGFLNDLEKITSNRKVRILLPKWVDKKVFQVFYRYLTSEDPQKRNQF